MCNGYDIVLLVQPYMEDNDAELQDLWTYLDTFLARAAWDNITAWDYLSKFTFGSTLLSKWS